MVEGSQGFGRAGRVKMEGETRTKRRSWLLAPVSQSDAVEEAATSGADVIVLDLVELVADQHKPGARKSFRGAIDKARAGGAEVFAQIDPKLLIPDLEACAWPGLSGVIVSRAESAEQIEEATALLAKLEKERRIALNTLKIIPALETAPGNHAAYEIASASPRVCGVTLGRADLIMDLRPEPSGEIHLMSYLMQRLVVIAGALGVTPIGAWWRAPDRGLLATPENTFSAATRGRAIGFRGAMCLRVNQVEPLNRGFN